MRNTQEQTNATEDGTMTTEELKENINLFVRLILLLATIVKKVINLVKYIKERMIAQKKQEDAHHSEENK